MPDPICFLHFTSREGNKTYIRLDQIEAVIADGSGSRIRVCGHNLFYEVDENTTEVFRLINQAIEGMRVQNRLD